MWELIKHFPSFCLFLEVSIYNENLEGRMRKYSFIFPSFWMFNDVTEALDNVFRDISPPTANKFNFKNQLCSPSLIQFLVLYIMKMYGVLTHLRLRQIKSSKIGDDIIEISKALLCFSKYIHFVRTCSTISFLFISQFMFRYFKKKTKE